MLFKRAHPRFKVVDPQRCLRQQAARLIYHQAGRIVQQQLDFIRTVVEEDRKRRVIAAADLFVLPSVLEGCPISILEAMAEAGRWNGLGVFRASLRVPGMVLVCAASRNAPTRSSPGLGMMSGLISAAMVAITEVSRVGGNTKCDVPA